MLILFFSCEVLLHNSRTSQLIEEDTKIELTFLCNLRTTVLRGMNSFEVRVEVGQLNPMASL